MERMSCSLVFNSIPGILVLHGCDDAMSTSYGQSGEVNYLACLILYNIVGKFRKMERNSIRVIIQGSLVFSILKVI